MMENKSQVSIFKPTLIHPGLENYLSSLLYLTYVAPLSFSRTTSYHCPEPHEVQVLRHRRQNLSGQITSWSNLEVLTLAEIVPL